MPKKICNYYGCHKVINYSEKYCDEHKKEYTQRHKTYDELRRNKKSAEFYHSDPWLKTREAVLNKFNSIDIYAYYVDNEILSANTAHHIIEVNEDWSKRLSIDNLIAVSDKSHNIIHAAYKINKTEIQKLLFELKDKWVQESQKG